MAAATSGRCFRSSSGPRRSVSRSMTAFLFVRNARRSSGRTCAVSLILTATHSDSEMIWSTSLSTHLSMSPEMTNSASFSISRYALMSRSALTLAALMWSIGSGTVSGSVRTGKTLALGTSVSDSSNSWKDSVSNSLSRNARAVSPAFTSSVSLKSLTISVPTELASSCDPSSTVERGPVGAWYSPDSAIGVPPSLSTERSSVGMRMACASSSGTIRN